MNELFERVYLEYYASVFRYLITLTHDQVLAEEITQETFYKALKSFDKYDPRFKMYTWLCEIAKNTYFTHYKKAKKMEEYKNNENTEKDIISKIIDSETNLEILEIVHNLSEPYKEVFTLRVFGNLSFKEIGIIFKKSEAWARVTYYRAKISIKEKLK